VHQRQGRHRRAIGAARGRGARWAYRVYLGDASDWRVQCARPSHGQILHGQGLGNGGTTREPAYIDAAGDRIRLDTNYKNGISYTTLLIESKSQNDFNKTQAIGKARRQPVCEGNDPVQQFLDTHGICRLPESAFMKH
jgi:hypothetical protein